VKAHSSERRIDARLRLRTATATVRSEAVPLDPRGVVATAELARRAGRRRDSWLTAQNTQPQQGDYNKGQVPGRQK
jgi:hypothetical protein